MISSYTIPIFPLNDAIFFPKTDLPLNIFEPRYLEMIDFALSNERVVGMIQMTEDGNLYSKGCLGKITSFNSTEDGRYVVNLRGENIFTLQNEIASAHNFRIAKINREEYLLQDNIKPKINNIEKEKLLIAFNKFINDKNYKFDLNFFNEIETHDLLKFISMLGPFTTAEKQMLLESLDLGELYLKIKTLFEFSSQKKTPGNTVN